MVSYQLNESYNTLQRDMGPEARGRLLDLEMFTDPPREYEVPPTVTTNHHHRQHVGVECATSRCGTLP